jgi:molecular chaperone DnaK
MKEHADKLGDTDKQPLEAAIAKTRETAKGNDTGAIKAAISELEQASHAVSKVLYEAGSKGADSATAQRAAGAAPKSGSPDDEAEDVEFEVKDNS